MSTEKSKIMRFSKSGTKSRNNWRCGTDPLEEVNRFCYLGFHFQANGSHVTHVKEMVKRAGRQISRVWSLAERTFPDNYLVRAQMFQSLIEPVALYGCEVFGYKEYEELEKIQRKHLRWTLGLPTWTKNSKIMAETRSRPLFLKTASRARNYEERINSPCSMLRECFFEMEEQERPQTLLAKSREKHWNSLGFSRQVVKEWKHNGVQTNALMTRRHLEQQMVIAVGEGMAAD